MRRLSSIILLTAIAMLLCPATLSKRTRTTRHTPKVAVAPDSTVIRTVADSIVEEAVTLSGYEKTLRSRIETLYAANSLENDTIFSLSVEIEYPDMRGRQLHRRIVEIACEIPPGQRRQLSFTSWDRQFVMYYHLSAPTRTSAQATPYDVKLTPRTVTISPTRKHK